MRNASVRLMGWALLLAVGGTLLGCKSDQSAATETARQFMEAAQKGDAQALKATLTTKAREKMNAGTSSRLNLKKNGTGDYTLGQATVDGDTAQVPMTVKQEGKETQGHVKLRREEGQWKVHALSIALVPGGQEMTLDLENPEAILGELMKQMPQVMGEGMKAMGEGFKAMGEGFKKAGDEMRKGDNNLASPR